MVISFFHRCFSLSLFFGIWNQKNLQSKHKPKPMFEIQALSATHSYAHKEQLTKSKKKQQNISGMKNLKILAFVYFESSLEIGSKHSCFFFARLTFEQMQTNDGIQWWIWANKNTVEIETWTHTNERARALACAHSPTNESVESACSQLRNILDFLSKPTVSGVFFSILTRVF